MIDLHVHSTCSDGTFSPKELVEYALSHNISAFALTDHDTVAGLDEAVSYAASLSGKVCDKNPAGNTLTVISGIELSTEYECGDIHVVGLFINYQKKAFRIISLPLWPPESCATKNVPPAAGARHRHHI